MDGQAPILLENRFGDAGEQYSTYIGVDFERRLWGKPRHMLLQ